MTDCPNAEIRDLLPDLLHERLGASARAAVMAHVGECADCRAELSLLRQMRVSLSSGIVALDTNAIARSVVARTTASPRVSRSLRRNRFSDWRLAAAIAILAVGGTTAVLVHSTRAPHEVGNVVASSAPVPRQKTSVGAPTRMAQEPVSPAARPIVPVAPRSAPSPGAELAAAGDVSDLSDSDLRTLLGDLDTIQALPATDPEPVSVRVMLPERGGTE